MKAATALLALAPFAAAAAERPPTMPTRDVDVVYMMVQPDARGGPRVVEERLRWAVEAGKLRIDPPTKGMWMVMDTRTHRLATVREADRSVFEIASDQAMPGPPAGAEFVRRGTDTVAGVVCTEWQTVDVTGTPTVACITDDGVLLRAAAGGQVLVEALRLGYAAQDPALFRLPAGYRRTAPPAPSSRTTP